MCQLLAWFLTPRLPERQHQVQRLPNKWQGWLGQDLGWMEAWDQDPLFFMPMGRPYLQLLNFPSSIPPWFFPFLCIKPRLTYGAGQQHPGSDELSFRVHC